MTDTFHAPDMSGKWPVVRLLPASGCGPFQLLACLGCLCRPCAAVLWLHISEPEAGFGKLGRELQQLTVGTFLLMHLLAFFRILQKLTAKLDN